MKQIYTEIEINAPINNVWNILTEFDKYPSWNPFIKSINGEVKEGSIFKVTLQQPGSKPITLSPRCLKFEKESEFRWLGHLLFPGLFDGEHIFILEKLDTNKTKLIQKENFKGILVPLLWKQLNTKTRNGFELMNQKIKENT
jgi:hypothetical protein